jgi:glucose/arabinose dehydrogenase
MAFYTGKQFPAKYQGGSSRAARLVEPHQADRRARDVHLAEGRRHGRQDRGVRRGWLDDDTGTYRGRPVDVAVMKDGSLLVSDDYAGALYRITYAAP